MSSCGCHDSEGIEGVTAAPQNNPQYVTEGQSPARVAYHYHKCDCGCLELRERVAVLEQHVYQLGLIIENREKAAGEPQPKRRFIGDKPA